MEIDQVRVEKNWNLCALCEENTDEKLVYPLNSTRESLANNLQQFCEIGEVPIPIPLSSLDEGNGFAETLTAHEAKWHKSCFNRCNNLKLQRAKKRKLEESTLETCEAPSPVKTRASLGIEPKVLNAEDSPCICFFCDEAGGSLHRAATLTIDSKVREAATKLQDRKLLAKLAAGDMHAIDAYYHAGCLTSLYNRLRRVVPKEGKSSTSQVSLEAIALAELAAYVEDGADQTVFKLSDLSKLYSSRLQQLGAYVPERVNSTRLKERLLAQLPDLREYSDGKEVRLAFSNNISEALKFAQDYDYDSEAIHLAKAATYIRKEIMMKQKNFTGFFASDCQRQAVPESLLALVNMILEGPNIKNQNEQEGAGTNAALMLSQLLIFNAVKRQRDPRSESTTSRHSQMKETPLPIYLGLVIHAETRKKTLVDKFYRLGLSISYDRVMQISADLGNSVCAQFEKDGVVCPAKLKKSLFTTGNVDNIDHNPSARTAKDSFHGTAISLSQHPSTDADGIARDRVLINPESPKKKSLSQLPERYTDIQPVAVQAKKDLFVPIGSGSAKPSSDLISESMKSEYRWLENVEALLEKETLEKKDYISWSAYFASMQTQEPRAQAITALLPLFDENAHTMAMIQHSMKIVKESVAFINPEQTPVIAMDQPLFAIAKQIQWKKADVYGEEKYVVMMGGLHIEMASLKMVGHWLGNSGWESALVQADVTTKGRADGILKAAHITRSRYAHQVSACALYTLQRSAYKEYTVVTNMLTLHLGYRNNVKSIHSFFTGQPHWSWSLLF